MRPQAAGAGGVPGDAGSSRLDRQPGTGKQETNPFLGIVETAFGLSFSKGTLLFSPDLFSEGFQKPLCAWGEARREEQRVNTQGGKDGDRRKKSWEELENTLSLSWNRVRVM